MPFDPDAIACACTSQYESLPPKSGKPVQTPQQRQWTVLAGAVLSCTQAGEAQHHVVSLATGVKCLPFELYEQHGDVVHDLHAEVLVRRGLRRWILLQIVADAKKGPAPLANLLEPVFHPEHNGTWRWNKRYELSLYVSRVPCGSASAALLPEEEASVPCPPAKEAYVVRGRTDLSKREQVRTKPGRTDAPVATSMSCSDKLALWNVVGLQGSLVSELVPEGVRYSHLVVGLDGLEAGNKMDPARQEILVQNLFRALVDRVGSVLQASDRPSVHSTTHPFLHSHDSVGLVPGGPLIAYADALSYVPTFGVSKLSPLGIKAGAAAKRPRLPTGEKGAFKTKCCTPLCKQAWFSEFSTTTILLHDADSAGQAIPRTYYQAKHVDRGGVREYRARKVLARGSQARGVKALVEFLQTHKVHLPNASSFASEATEEPSDAPLDGWLISGLLCEHFSP